MLRVKSNTPYHVRCLIRDVNKTNQLLHPDEIIIENSSERFEAALSKQSFFKRNVMFEAALTISVSLHARLTAEIQQAFEVKGSVAERAFVINTQKKNPDFANVAMLARALAAQVEIENPGALAQVQFKQMIKDAIYNDNERLCCSMPTATQQRMQAFDTSDATRRVLKGKKKAYITATAAVAVVTAALVSVALFACITGFFPILTVLSVVVGVPLAIITGVYTKTFADRATAYRRLSSHINTFFSPAHQQSIRHENPKEIRKSG